MHSQPYFTLCLRQKSFLTPLLLGVILSLGLALLAGCGPAGAADAPPATQAPAIASSQAAAPPATPVPVATPPASPAGGGSNPPSTASTGDTLSIPAAPVTIGEMTFAQEVTANREPVNPSMFFTSGITQVHAVFNYSGMKPGYTWERVWLLDDKEVSRKADPWTGPESGVFDYTIDNGGRALPAGDWVLQLYVEGQLRSVGVFIVE